MYVIERASLVLGFGSLTSELGLPLVCIRRGDLLEDGANLANLVSGWDELELDRRVNLELTDDGLVSKSTFDGQLLVDLGRETRHERL